MAQKHERSKIFIQIQTVIPIVTLEFLYLLNMYAFLFALVSIVLY